MCPPGRSFLERLSWAPVCGPGLPLHVPVASEVHVQVSTPSWPPRGGAEPLGPLQLEPHGAHRRCWHAGDSLSVKDTRPFLVLLEALGCSVLSDSLAYTQQVVLLIGRVGSVSLWYLGVQRGGGWPDGSEPVTPAGPPRACRQVKGGRHVFFSSVWVAPVAP